MKKIFIIIFLLFIVGCVTTTKDIKNDYNTISNIDEQLNNPDLQLKPDDSADVIKHKKKIIKTLQEAKDTILKENEANVKLEKQKDDLLGNAEVGKFVKQITALIALMTAAYIISKIKSIF